MDIVSILSGGFLGFLAAVVFAMAIYLYWFMQESKNKYLLIVNSYNDLGGKTVEILKARKEVNKELGSCYVLPKYEKTNRMYAPDVGTIHEYPITGDIFRKFAVFLTYRDGTYSPMVDEIKAKEKVKYIREEDIIDQKTGAPSGKKRFVIDEKEIETWATKPAKSSMRQFHLYADSMVLENFRDEQSWLQKYGPLVLGMSMVLGAVVLCVMMLILTAENADKIVTLLPQASEQIAARTAEIIAQQNETTQGGIIPLIPSGQ